MLSKTCEYAIRSVLYVANQQFINTGMKSGIKQISESLNIPAHFLGKILQTLTRHEIMSSAKGPNGGFYLNEQQQRNPLLSIVEVIDGLKIFSRCGLGLEKCSSEHPCPLHNDFASYRDGMENALRNYTVEDTISGLIKGDVFLTSL
ncbi:MAG: Rrf2 family transcriptional regulator [Calditrichaeota bacterium]|nr:Rrf2 family transcriptional regulator [Calditrichota bacterium]